MRCDECKTDPLTPGHYCECCGRKLSLQERRALESTLTPAFTAAPESVEGHEPAIGDRLVSVHVQSQEAVAGVAVAPAPPVPAPALGFLDPILEAHFAGQAAVVPAPAPAVNAAPAVAPPIAPVAVAVAAPATKAAPRALATNDWVEPAANVSPVVTVELYTDMAPVDVPSSHNDRDAPFPRCEVCGAHAEDGDLCATCRETFHSLLEAPRPARAAEPVQAVDAPPAGVQAHEEAPAPAPVVHDASASVEVAPAVSPAPSTHPVTTAAAVAVAPVVPVVAEPPAPAGVPARVHVETPAPAAVVQPAPAIQIKVRPPVAPQSATHPAPASVEAAPSRPQVPPAAASKPTPARVSPPPAPQSQPASNGRKVAAVVAVAVALAAIGFPLSKMWLGQQETPAIVHEQPAPAVTPPPAVAPAPKPSPESNSLPPAPPPEPVVVARAETTAPATPKGQPGVPPSSKPAVSSRPAAAVKSPVKTVRQPVAPPRPVAASPVSSPAAAAPAPEVAPPVAVAAPEPKPEAPAAPIGPFFELRDVNEVPRVLNRVEPHLPEDLRDRQLNEVVIVRVLVTQAGQPMMVNILRRSKAGASLDEAIVAAVKKWTFAPATRKGQPVSCWYHVGVPVNVAH